MASWRDTTSERAQSDFDAVLGAALPLAERILGQSGEMYPFGVSVSNDGEVAILGANPGTEDDRPPSQDVLSLLHDGARAQASDHRAFAFAADVRFDGGDAILVEVEHREGTALAILVPYTRSRIRKIVSLGQMTVQSGSNRVWPSP